MTKRPQKTATLPILGWSSRDVPSSQLRDYAAHAIESGLESMSVEFPKPVGFTAEFSCVSLGGVTVAHGAGEDLRCIHGKREIARSLERNFHVIVNRRSGWTLQHRGAQVVRINDAAIMDSAFDYDFSYPPFDNTHIQMGESWLAQWVPDPRALVGRVVPRDSRWGAALCAYVRMLTPEFLVQAPLPVSVILDHIGSLLALVADDLSGDVEAPRRSQRRLAEEILDVVRQRCAEPGLVAAQVGVALKISTRTVHRQLAALHLTFGGALIGARVRNATRMLEAKGFRRVTIGEIARRSGFTDPSHFSRVVRASVGRSPMEIRRGAGTLGLGQSGK